MSVFWRHQMQLALTEADIVQIGHQRILMIPVDDELLDHFAAIGSDDEDFELDDPDEDDDPLADNGDHEPEPEDQVA